MTPHETFRPRTNQKKHFKGLSKQSRRYLWVVPRNNDQDCSPLWECRLEGHQLHLICTLNTDNSKQRALYLVVLLLLAVDGRQQAIAFKAPGLLWHNVTGHLFSFFGLSHHSQNLSLQNHTDLGLDSTWLSSYQRNHSGNISHKSAQHLFVTHREGWLTTVINNRL